MKSLLLKITPPCGTVVEKYSASLADEGISLSAWLHTRACHHCATYLQQVSKMREVSTDARLHEMVQQNQFKLTDAQKNQVLAGIKRRLAKNQPAETAWPEGYPSSQIWLRFAAPALALLLVVVFLIQPWQSPRFKVESLNGTARVNGEVVKAGQLLDEVKVVETSEGDIGIVVDEENIFQLKANSKAVFNMVERNIHLEKGHLVALVLQQKKEPFAISSPYHRANLTGTVVYTVVEPGKVYSCLCHGHYTVSGPGGSPSQKFSTDHHLATEVNHLGGGVTIKKSGMYHHMDADIDKLAARVNKKIHWYKL